MIEITRAFVARGRESVARLARLGRRVGALPLAPVILMVQPVVDAGVLMPSLGYQGSIAGYVPHLPAVLSCSRHW